MKTALFGLLFAGSLAAQTAVYPGAVVTDNQLRVARNLVTTSLATAINSSATTLSVSSGTGIVINGLLTIDAEIFAVCGVSGTTVTIGKSSCPNVDGRGFDSSTAASHAAGARVSVFVDAWYHNATAAEVKAIETALGPNLVNVLAGTAQPAHFGLFGPTSGGSAVPTWRLLVASDLPSSITANTTGTSSGFTGALLGDVTGTQGATVVGSTGGVPFAPSATLDTTVANNVSHGVLPANVIPPPTASTLGGVNSKDCSGTSQFLQTIGTDGAITCGTPTGGGNVSGPGPVTAGFIPQWGGSNNLLTTGLAASATPGNSTVVISNSSGFLNAGWMPGFTGDASNTAGATVLTLATVNSGPGACGDAGHVCVITTNGKGLVTAQSTSTITAAAGGSNTQLQVNTSGVLAGLADFTFGTPHTLNVGAAGILDAHLGAFLLPGSLSTGLVTVTTTTGAVSSVAAPSGAVVGTTDTQTLTNKSIAGSQINSSTVGSTYGGTGADLHASTGFLRAGNPMTVTELSGDVSTGGSGTVIVSKVNGVTYAGAPSSVDSVPVAILTSVMDYKVIPNCGDASHALAYSTSTHGFSCQNITAAAGAVTLDSLLAAGGALVLNNGNYTQTWGWSLTTPNAVGMKFNEFTTGTSPGEILVNIETNSGSGTLPLVVTGGGAANGIQVDSSGILSKIGSGQVNADHFNGNATIAVANGGTSLTTLTAHALLIGNGTSAPTLLAAGAADTLLQGQGASSNPAYAALVNCGDATHALAYSTSSHAFTCQAITASALPGGSTTQLQYNNAGALGGTADFTYVSHTIASGSSGIVDLHLAASGGFFLPGAIATGLVTVTTSTGAVSSVAAPAGAVVGTTDTQTLTNKSIDASEVNSGILPIARGGTGQSTASAAFNALSPVTTLGDLIYGDGANSNARLAGNTTSTQKFLCQTGTGSVSAAPAWCTPSSGGVTSVVNDTNVTGSIVGSVLTLGWTGTLAAGRLNANVVQAISNDTNITGSISTQNLTLAWAGVLGVTRGGTGLASYTSGGIPYASSSTTLASSAALTIDLPVFGGGAGAAPFSGTRSGNTTQVATWSGATTASRCVETDAFGNLTVTAGACTGTPFGSLGDFFGTGDGTTAVFAPGWVIGASQLLVWNGGIKQRPGSGNDFTTTTTGVTAATYASGITATGATGSTCLVSSFGGGGTLASGTLVLTGTNTIAFGTAVQLSSAGSGYGSPPTTASVFSGTATCSGSVNLNTSSIGSAVIFASAPQSGIVVEILQ